MYSHSASVQGGAVSGWEVLFVDTARRWVPQAGATGAGRGRREDRSEIVARPAGRQQALGGGEATLPIENQQICPVAGWVVVGDRGVID